MRDLCVCVYKYIYVCVFLFMKKCICVGQRRKFSEECDMRVVVEESNGDC